MWTVYKHTTPNGKIYIGITSQKPENRWLCGHGYDSNKHFWNAIQRYGWNNIKHEIICEGLTQEQAENMERDLIFRYKSYDKDFGYNKALGGHALSEESRKKISKTRKERGYTSWNCGKHLSEETKQKIRESNTGRHYTMSKEGREHISKSKLGEKNPNYGKPMSEKNKKHLSELYSKPVVQFTKYGRIFYSSIKEASDKTGVTASNITRVCNGERITAGGYMWAFTIDETGKDWSRVTAV